MKYFLFLFIFIFLNTNAQNILNFNKRNVECEDKWIAYQMDKDSLYTYGFIYIDQQAGLTFNYEGEFKINKSGTFTTSRIIDVGLKSRLQPNQILIAIIPEEIFKELHISKIPDWLKYYKDNENAIENLYKKGYNYNGWSECGKALEYLELAYIKNSNYKGLKVELAYSYNCLKQYEKAIQILKEALLSEPNDSYINKELIFAQTKLNQIEIAETSFRIALKQRNSINYNAENAFQILQGYFINKNEINFQRFLNEFIDLLNSDKRFPTLIEKMKFEIKK